MAPNARIYLAVAAGGAIGSLLRAGVSLALLDQAWPILLGGTLAANVLGAFGIGIWAALGAPDGRWPHAPVARHFWMTGVFGGLTTFSIFSLEALVLMSTGAWGALAAYVGVSVPAWLGAVWLGHRLGCALNG